MLSAVRYNNTVSSGQTAKKRISDMTEGKVSEMSGGWFDDFFDLNNDGKVDVGEQYIAYKIFEECTKDDSDNDDD